MSKTIVIVGVTGLQGSSVAKKFLSIPGWKVRGITRDPSGAKASALASSGVEIVQGDLDDGHPSSLVPALTGANAIFCNTDFFTPVFAAMTAAAAATTTVSGPEQDEDAQAQAVLQRAYEREVAQNLAVAEAASSPAVLATLERFVLSTLTDARGVSGGRYDSVYHFDSKAEAARRVRAEFPQVFARMNSLLMGHYTSNWTAVPVMYPQRKKQQQQQEQGHADGTEMEKKKKNGEEQEEQETFIVTRPFSPSTLVPFVDAARDTGEFVRALVLDLPAGATLLGASEIMTFPQFAALWATTLGKRAEYRQTEGGAGVFLEDVPSPLRQEIAASFDFWEEFGYWGRDEAVLLPEQLEKKLSLTSMREVIEKEDWSMVLQ